MIGQPSGVEGIVGVGGEATVNVEKDIASGEEKKWIGGGAVRERRRGRRDR